MPEKGNIENGLLLHITTEDVKRHVNVDPQLGTVHANFASCLCRRWNALAVCPIGTLIFGIEWITPRRFVVNHWKHYYFGVGVTDCFR